MWHIVGQPKAVELLKRSLETNHLAHAYLFVGPPHVGKMTLAINLAQALNCDGSASLTMKGELRPFDSAQDRPFDSAQDRPFDSAQDRPFDSAQDRPVGRLQ